MTVVMWGLAPEVTRMTITRLRPLGIDANNDPIDGEPARVELLGCTLAPRFSIGARTTTGAVDERGREGVVVGLTLYGPYDIDLLPTDLVEVVDPDINDGDPVLWSVIGAPGRWKSKFTGRRRGSEIALRRGKG